MSGFLLAPPASLYDTLFVRDGPRIIAAVGGGGKTTFLKTLAVELSLRGAKVILTTTTKMYPPKDHALLGTSVEEVITRLENHSVVWAGQLIAEEKMTGIPHSLSRLTAAADYILVEADGSRKRPLKMTDPCYEPVIPAEAEAVVALAGLDSLGMSVDEAIHRPAMACRLLNSSPSQPVTPEIIARLLRHCYAPRYVLLNKADTPERRKAGLYIASLMPETHCLIASLREWGQTEMR